MNPDILSETGFQDRRTTRLCDLGKMQEIASLIRFTATTEVYHPVSDTLYRIWGNIGCSLLLQSGNRLCTAGKLK